VFVRAFPALDLGNEHLDPAPADGTEVLADRSERRVVVADVLAVVVSDHAHVPGHRQAAL
jgi:hypothetical protein